MGYLTIIKTSKGFRHVYGLDPDDLCAKLNNIGDLQLFSVVSSEPPSLKVETDKEFDKGYEAAKKAIEQGSRPTALYNQMAGANAFEKGWKAACEGAMMQENLPLKSRALNETPLPDLSMEAIMNDIKPPRVNHKPQKLKGRWYKYNGILAVYTGLGEPTYGKLEKGWLSVGKMDWDYPWELASEDDIRAALVDEAWRRYGAEKIDMCGEYVDFKDLELSYVAGRDALCGYSEKSRCALDLFSAGKWLEPANPIKEGAQLFGIKSYSEKELHGFIDQIVAELKNRKS